MRYLTVACVEWALISDLNEGVSDAGVAVKGEPTSGDLAGGHRVLIFAQLKGLLDLVQSDIMHPHGISHLRLDGRHASSLLIEILATWA